MRKSLRQIQRKEPKCANCNVNCVQDEKRAFSDPLSPFFPPFSFPSSQLPGESDDNTEQSAGTSKVIKTEAEEITADILETETEEAVSRGWTNEETKQNKIRKTPTIFDALVKLFSKEWKMVSDLLDSTVNDKENLILCSDCSWCLSQLYEWHSKFIQPSLESRRHSYLYPLLSLCHNNKYKYLLHSSFVKRRREGQKDGIDSFSHPNSDPKLKSSRIRLRRVEIERERHKSQSGSPQLSTHEAQNKEFPETVTESEELEIGHLDVKGEETGEAFSPMEDKEVTEGHDDQNQRTSSPSYKTAFRHPKQKQRKSCKSPKKRKKLLSESGAAEENELGTGELKKEKSERKTPITKKEKKISAKPRRVALLRYICPDEGCGFEAQLKEEYMGHMETVHGKVDVQLIPVQDESDDSVCLICNSVFTSKAELSAHCSLKHIPSIRIRSHACAECPKMFVTKHDLRNHEATHVVSSGFTCSDCPFRTRRVQELERHLKLVHLQEKNFFCPICKKGYALKWQLNDHARIHKEERNFYCSEPGCGKAFRTPSNLRQHLELHRGSKFVCDICGQSYSRKAYLRLHMNGTHLMLPLPPSQKRERKRNPNSAPKRPRLKSSKPRDLNSKTLIIKRINIPQAQSLTATDLIPGTPGGGEIPGVGGEEPGVMILEDYKYGNPPKDFARDEDDDGETIHVQLDLGEEEEERGQEQGAEVIQMESGRMEMELDPNTFGFTAGHQIICYPVGNLISTEVGNTFYITTTTGPAPPHQMSREDEGDGGGTTAITIFNPFTEFIPIQHQHN